MSWSSNIVGHPENVVKELEAQSLRETGQCKVEFDDAKPHLIGLVQQNFNNQTGQHAPVIHLQAQGSGWATDGKQMQRSCSIKLDVNYTKLV